MCVFASRLVETWFYPCPLLEFQLLNTPPVYTGRFRNSHDGANWTFSRDISAEQVRSRCQRALYPRLEMVDGNREEATEETVVDYQERRQRTVETHN